MKARPIIMGAESVRAILAGRKTQTRRTVRLAHPEAADAFVHAPERGANVWQSGECHHGAYAHAETVPCPYGAVGDRLWIKEAHFARYFDDGRPSYRADWTGVAADVCPEPKWSSPIFMRRSDSRLTLEVTGVRVERLHDLTEEDALAEGVEISRCACETCARSSSLCTADASAAIEAYAEAWEAISGKRAPWATNPWVWVVSFRRVDDVARAPGGAR